MTDADIYAENQLFATLDTTVRTLVLEKQKVLLSDTVGFIRDLPKELLEAFQATLEELQDADVLLHVVDASNPNYQTQIKAVENILQGLKIEQKPIIYVFNKIDLVDDETEFLAYPESICVSAKNAQGLEKLKEMLYHKLFGSAKWLNIFLPIADSGKISRFYSLGQVENVEYTEDGVTFSLYVSGALPEELAKYIQMER